MTVSFVINKAPIFRVFTVEESTALYRIEVDENFVEIIFRSNTEKAYLFRGSDRLIPHLIEVLKSPDLLGQSLGSLIARSRKIGDLQQIEWIED